MRHSACGVAEGPRSCSPEDPAGSNSKLIEKFRVNISKLQEIQPEVHKPGNLAAPVAALPAKLEAEAHTDCASRIAAGAAEPEAPGSNRSKNTRLTNQAANQRVAEMPAADDHP